MSSTGQKTVLTNINAGLLALERQLIPFRLPFKTCKQNYVYFVDDCILAESDSLDFTIAASSSPNASWKRTQLAVFGQLVSHPRLGRELGSKG
jgi:hypothetical protein